MQGGVNAFLRSRSPLNLPPPRPWPPSRRWCKALYTVSICGVIVEAGSYVATYFSSRMLAGGGWLLVVWILPIPLLAPLGRPEYWRDSLWEMNWPFRNRDAAYAKWVTAAIALAAAGHLIFYLSVENGGVPEAGRGYALIDHGRLLRELTASEYVHVQMLMLQPLLLWSLMFWFMAAALWRQLLGDARR